MTARRPLVLVTGSPNTIRRLVNGDALLVEEFANRSGVVYLRTVDNASAVNLLEVRPGATGTGPTLKAEGSDTNINLLLAPKGTGWAYVGSDPVVAAGKQQVVANKTLQDSDLLDPTNRLPFNASRGCVRQIIKDPLAGTFTVVGWPAAPTTDGTVATADTIVRPLASFTTAASSGAKSGLATAAVFRAWSPEIVIPVRWGSTITDVRYWIGFSTADLATVTDPTTEHVASFRYDDTVDSEIMAVTNDGASAPDVQGTGVTPIPSGYSELRIRCTDAGEALFFIDDTLVSAHSGRVPGATQQIQIRCRVETLTAAARVLNLGTIALAMR